MGEVLTTTSVPARLPEVGGQPRLSNAVSPPLLGTALVFLYLFNLELKSLGGFALSYLILLLVLRLPFQSSTGFSLPYLRHGAAVFLLLLPPFVWTLVYFYYYQSDATILLVSAIKTFVWSWCVAALLCELYLRDGSFERYLSNILASFVFALVAQSVFIVLSFIDPGFSEFVNSLLVAKGNLTGLEDFRSKGLANSGGPNMSMLLAFGVVASLWLFHLIGRSKYFLFAIFMAIASALVGRSGFIAALLVITLYCFLGRLKIWLAVFVFLLLVLGLLFSVQTLIDTNTPWAKWFFLEAGDSVSDLRSMIFNTTDVISLVYGAGFFEIPVGDHERSDSGFVKAVLSLGVPLALYFYGVIFFIFRSAFQTMRERIRLGRGALFYLAIAVTLLMLAAFEFKESMLYQNMTGRALFWFANMVVIFRLREMRQSSG